MPVHLRDFAGLSLEVQSFKDSDIIVQASSKQARLVTYGGQRMSMSTHLAERVPAIAPPEADGVEVLVCVQGLGGAQPLKLPTQVDRVVEVPGRGVARSRNAAIEAASCRYLLFCDDDVQVRSPVAGGRARAAVQCTAIRGSTHPISETNSSR